MKAKTYNVPINLFLQQEIIIEVSAESEEEALETVQNMSNLELLRIAENSLDLEVEILDGEIEESDEDLDEDDKEDDIDIDDEDDEEEDEEDDIEDE